jgi:small conductance mechanosensitive channel
METVYSILWTVIILASIFIIGKLLERNHDKQLKQGKFKTLVLLRCFRTLLYFAGIIAIIFFWIPEIGIVLQFLDSINPLLTKLCMVVALWVGTLYTVRTISSIIFELKDAESIKPVNEEIGVLTQKLFAYIAYIVAIIWTLTIFGVTGAIEGMLVGAGFAGIVVGFAARDVLSNLLAGISLLLDRPFKIGQWIHLKNSNLVGEVKEISLRSTVILAPDNTLINLPNALVASEPIVNYSSHKLRRFFLDVGISYESDVGKAMKVIKETLEKDPATAKQGIKNQGYYAPIEIVVDNFGDSSVNLTAKVFINTQEAGGQFLTKSRMLENIKKNLTKAGIEIPYPRQYVIFDKDQKRKRKK